MLCLVAESCSYCVLQGSSGNGLYPAGSSAKGNSPHKYTRVGCHAVLQGIFPNQRSKSGFPHCRQFLYHLSHTGSPKIVECVAYPFSGDLPDPGIERGSPALQEDSLPAELLLQKQAQHWESWRAQVDYASGPEELILQALSPEQRDYRVFIDRL